MSGSFALEPPSMSGMTIETFVGPPIAPAVFEEHNDMMIAADDFVDLHPKKIPISQQPLKVTQHFALVVAWF